VANAIEAREASPFPEELLLTVWRTLAPADQQVALEWMVACSRSYPLPTPPPPPPSPPIKPTKSPAAASRNPQGTPASRSASSSAPPARAIEKLLWSLPEAARHWGVSRSTVFRKVTLGQLPAFRLYGHYVIPRNVVNGLPVPLETAVRWTTQQNAGWHAVVPDAVNQWLEQMQSQSSAKEEEGDLS